MYLLNAFSLNMVAEFPATIEVQEISAAQAAEMVVGCESAVGHADTAAVFGSVLGTDVPMNRLSISLSRGETALVGQYSDPRLPEGSTTLPEGADIRWLKVVVS